MRVYQGSWRSRQRHAMRARHIHPGTRVRATSPCVPTGQVGPSLLRLATGSGREWVSTRSALTHADARLAGTLAMVGGAGDDASWVLRPDQPSAQGNTAWATLRRKDETGFCRRTSVGWDGQGRRVTDPGAAPQYNVTTVEGTMGTVAVGTWIDEAAPPGRCPVACSEGRRPQTHRSATAGAARYGG